MEGYYISKNVCDSLIKLFEKSDTKKEGETTNGVDKKRKKSTDVSFYFDDIQNYLELNNYFKELSKCLELYKSKYKFCDKIVTYWELEKIFNIQKYKFNEA